MASLSNLNPRHQLQISAARNIDLRSEAYNNQQVIQTIKLGPYQSVPNPMFPRTRAIASVVSAAVAVPNEIVTASTPGPVETTRRYATSVPSRVRGLLSRLPRLPSNLVRPG